MSLLYLGPLPVGQSVCWPHNKLPVSVVGGPSANLERTIVDHTEPADVIDARQFLRPLHILVLALGWHPPGRQTKARSTEL